MGTGNNNTGNTKPGAPPPGAPPPKTKEQLQAEQEKEEKAQNKKNCCKKVLKFTFSHIGLCGMVIAYSVLGGFIFQHLEQTNEKMVCMKAFERYSPAENDTTYKLWDISASFRQDDDQEFALIEFQKVLQNFRKIVLDLDYDGRNCSMYGEVDGPTYNWNFPGAMLFSVTVITTIGYGNIAPKTFWGRLVCMAYAVLGIPLMLLCLANIGDVLADVFRYVYTKVCCCGCCRRSDKNKVEAMPNSKGRGTPEAWKHQYTQNKMGDGKGPVVVDDDEDDEEEDEDEKISVPLTITMAIICIYIFLGALLFGVWEGWDPLKASYFCFVTVSTIGFGDVVPGSASFESATDQWKMVGAAIYMLFGMAILSMCFSLIQEEIVAKFRWVGEKIGIIEKDKDEDEKEDEEDDAQKKKNPNPQQGKPMMKGPPPPPGVQRGPPPPKTAQSGQPMKGPRPTGPPPPGMPPAKTPYPPPNAKTPGPHQRPTAKPAPPPPK